MVNLNFASINFVKNYIIIIYTNNVNNCKIIIYTNKKQLNRALELAWPSEGLRHNIMHIICSNASIFPALG